MTDPLQCTFADAARNHLRDGIRLSTAAKVDFFEEMVTLAVHFGARNRTRERGAAGRDGFDSPPQQAAAKIEGEVHSVPGFHRGNM